MDDVAAVLCDAIYLPSRTDRESKFSISEFSIQDDSVRQHDEAEEASFKPSYVIALNERTKSLCLVFKGSADIEDWFTNAFFMPMSVDGSAAASTFKVHGGYWSTLRESTIDEILHKMNAILEKKGDVQHILITGHSKGGGYAMLARTFWICYRPRIAATHRALDAFHDRVRVVTFGAPLVFSVSNGDYTLAERIPRELHDEITAYVFRNDLVPRLLGDKRSAIELSVQQQKNKSRHAAQHARSKQMRGWRAR
jgi:hypothetical protein